jgi:hypothetical protein
MYSAEPFRGGTQSTSTERLNCDYSDSNDEYVCNSSYVRNNNSNKQLNNNRKINLNSYRKLNYSEGTSSGDFFVFVLNVKQTF